MSFPIKTQNFRADIGGADTDFSISQYSDRTLVLVTQVGSVGSFIAASQDGGASSSQAMQADENFEDGRPAAMTYSTSVLFGRRDEPAFHLGARQIIENMQKARGTGQGGQGPNLLLGLGLRDHSIGTIKAVVGAIEQAIF